MGNIPEYVYSMAEYTPVIDVALAVLNEAFPDLAAEGKIVSLLPDKADKIPLILVRDSYDQGWAGQHYGLETATVEIHVFTQDPDADGYIEGVPSGEVQGAVLSEAIRVAMRDAWLAKSVYPGVASIANIQMVSRPRRVTDWATASGPVQYANLPTGYWRHESSYRITYRSLP